MVREINLFDSRLNNNSFITEIRKLQEKLSSEFKLKETVYSYPETNYLSLYAIEGKDGYREWVSQGRPPLYMIEGCNKVKLYQTLQNDIAIETEFWAGETSLMFQQNIKNLIKSLQNKDTNIRTYSDKNYYRIIYLNTKTKLEYAYLTMLEFTKDVHREYIYDVERHKLKKSLLKIREHVCALRNYMEEYKTIENLINIWGNYNFCYPIKKEMVNLEIFINAFLSTNFSVNLINKNGKYKEIDNDSHVYFIINNLIKQCILELKEIYSICRNYREIEKEFLSFYDCSGRNPFKLYGIRNILDNFEKIHESMSFKVA